MTSTSINSWLIVSKVVVKLGRIMDVEYSRAENEFYKY